MAKVLVTGAAGFVGSNLVRALEASGEEVFIFLRPGSKDWRLRELLPKLKTAIVDLTDAALVRTSVKAIRPEIVYHLAATGGYPFQRNWNASFQSNILGPLHLLQALEGLDSLQKFVNIGSSSEYGQKTEPMRETDCLEPDTPYGITKSGQTLLASYFGRQKGLPLVTLRLFSVYGPYEEPGRLVTTLMLALLRGQIAKLFSPLPRRDFAFVGDVLTACFQAATSQGKNGEIFNIGSGEDHSVGETIVLLQEIAGKKLSVEWGEESQKRSFDHNQKWAADITKTKRELDWQPRISFQEGLLRTYRWYQEHSHLYA